MTGSPVPLLPRWRGELVTLRGVPGMLGTALAAPAARAAGEARPAGQPSAQRARARRAAQPQRASKPEAPALPPRIGVISDTHGYLDPIVLEHFAGVAHIIHAGDVMDAKILTALEHVAPLSAVAGNLDGPELTERLPRELSGEVAGVRFLVGHKPKRLLNRLAAGKIEGPRPDLVVWGHTHVPAVAWVDGALYLNPGTASSPDDEDDGPTVAIVEVQATGLAVRFIPLVRRSPGEVGMADRPGKRVGAGS